MRLSVPTARFLGAHAACRSACVCLCIWAGFVNNKFQSQVGDDATAGNGARFAGLIGAPMIGLARWTRIASRT
jgi:hypothetical protein